MYFSLFVGVLCSSLFCFALLFSFLVLQYVEEEEKTCCFAVIVLQMYCYYKCSVALPHGAVGGSAVCDYGIF